MLERINFHTTANQVRKDNIGHKKIKVIVKTPEKKNNIKYNIWQSLENIDQLLIGID